MRILVAEDDVASGTFVRKGLEAEHYAVDHRMESRRERWLRSLTLTSWCWI